MFQTECMAAPETPVVSISIITYDVVLAEHRISITSAISRDTKVY